MLPVRFGLEEFERDVALYQSLRPVSVALSKLIEVFEGTLMAVGSDAYNTALDVYAYAKLTEGVTGLESLRTMMSNRFRGPGQRREAEVEAEQRLK